MPVLKLMLKLMLFIICLVAETLEEQTVFLWKKDAVMDLGKNGAVLKISYGIKRSG